MHVEYTTGFFTDGVREKEGDDPDFMCVRRLKFRSYVVAGGERKKKKEEEL